MIFVPQREKADCGAACLAMIAQHHQRDVSLEAIKAALTPRLEGYTALQLIEWARSVGLRAEGVAADECALPHLPMPCILHWQDRHFVVLAGYTDGRYLILDPAAAGPDYVTSATLRSRFSGTAIIATDARQGKSFTQADRRDHR